jgi:type IV secretory pathway VirB10-like protein
MRRTSVVRFLTLLIVASFALTGPLAPLVHAQEPAQPVEGAQPAPAESGTAEAAPRPPAPPALVPPAPAQPAIVQATPTPPPAAQPVAPAPVQPAPAAAQPAQPMQPDLFQETLKGQRASDKSQWLYNTEAIFVSIFMVPGRAITCAAGTVVGVGLLGISLGSGYRAATNIFHEGCGGKWIVTGDDLRPDTPSSVVVTDPVR